MSRYSEYVEKRGDAEVWLLTKYRMAGWGWGGS